MTRDEFRDNLNTIMVDKMFTSKEAAYIVGVHYHTINKWRCGRLCPLDTAGHRTAILNRLCDAESKAYRSKAA